MRKSGCCKQLSLSVARSGPTDAENLVYGRKQQPKSHVECIRRQLLSACVLVCFYEFIFHFSLFFLPYCPFSIVWILKSVCERTSSHYSHVPLACPYIRTVLRWSWVWRIAVILLTGKLQYSEKTPATVPLCPPQIYADCPGNLEVHLNNWSLRKCSQTKCISHKTLIRPILRDGI